MTAPLREEPLPDGHVWARICDAGWDDPLDDTFARVRGGRWNPPASWRTLYLNEDRVTARLNLDLFIAGWPYEPEDLDDEAGPHLALARLPRGQVVADVHTPEGVAAAGLPAGYPHDAAGRLVGHDACQRVGAAARDAGLRGVRCRSAQAPHGAGRELAWFPATARSRAHLVAREPFGTWFWG
ncbi:MAG: RES family NAD+ phosphorylase [Actinomycetes bacterium]